MNVVMFTITGACTLLAVSVLFFILGYLLWKGGHALNWDFFTKLPVPVGETGGGFANAILGSAKLLILASNAIGTIIREYVGTRPGRHALAFAMKIKMHPIGFHQHHKLRIETPFPALSFVRINKQTITKTPQKFPIR